MGSQWVSYELLGLLVMKNVKGGGGLRGIVGEPGRVDVAQCPF